MILIRSYKHITRKCIRPLTRRLIWTLAVIMNWKFEQEEISNGGYALKGIRSSGNEVSLQADETEFYRIYEEAYNLEVSLGTLPSKALFAVISGAKQSWLGEYSDEAFGSWQVTDPTGSGYYVYDGKDFILLYYSKEETPEWQCYVREKADVTKQVFSSLA